MRGRPDVFQPCWKLLSHGQWHDPRLLRRTVALPGFQYHKDVILGILVSPPCPVCRGQLLCRGSGIVIDVGGSTHLLNQDPYDYYEQYRVSFGPGWDHFGRTGHLKTYDPSYCPANSTLTAVCSGSSLQPTLVPQPVPGNADPDTGESYVSLPDDQKPLLTLVVPAAP